MTRYCAVLPRKDATGYYLAFGTVKAAPDGTPWFHYPDGALMVDELRTGLWVPSGNGVSKLTPIDSDETEDHEESEAFTAAERNPSLVRRMSR